jgi:hypothetical protein
VKYNHACDIAFTVLSNDEHGVDLTPNMYRIALKKRIDELDRTNTWDDAINIFDTHED